MLARHRDLLVDGAGAVLLFGLLVGTIRVLIGDPSSPFHAPVGWPEYLIAATVTLPLTLRRRAPLIVMTVVVAAIAALQARHLMNTAVEVTAAVIAVYSAARYGHAVARKVVGAAGFVALVGLFAVAEAPPDMPDAEGPNPVGLLISLVVYGGAWWLGEQSRRGHERQRELEAITAQLRAERVRNAQQAATAERLRIARELHDVLGHHVSVMGVLASGAQRVLPPGADRAEQALTSIETSSRQAIAEMQRVLRLLREDRGAASSPLAGLGRLETIAGELRDAGVEVHLQIAVLPELPVSVELAAVRIAQEALTNVLHHAGPGTTAWVRLTDEDGTLQVTVEDDGRGRPARSRPDGGTGYGLIGLRERVAVHDGTLETGTRPAGGFRVAAQLPLEASSPTIASSSTT